MVSPKVTRHLDFLEHLAKASPRVRRFVLSSATPAEIEVLVEICANLCRGNIRLTRVQLKRINGHAAFARSLARKRTVNPARRLLQTGGTFALGPILLPLLIQAAVSLAP